MSDENRCGRALIALIEAYGVEHIFGIPGVHTLELYRGLAHSRLNHVLARHEQGAAFMADGYARVTGRPGVCMLISGPGVTNASTAIAEAYADSVRRANTVDWPYLMQSVRPCWPRPFSSTT